MLKNPSDKNLIGFLQNFQTLNPRADFVAASRTKILGETFPTEAPAPLRVIPSGWLFWARSYWQVPAFGLVLIAMFAVSYHLLATSTKLVFSALNSENISQEYANLINIQLGELKYQQKADQAIASALNEITNNTSHLNPSILESESSVLDIPDENQDNVNSLLDRIIL